MPKDLQKHGIRNVEAVHWNLPTPMLYEEAVRRREGSLTHLGPLVVSTGHYTGRSPKDRFVVREPSSESKIWWGEQNRPFDPERYEQLKARLLAYLQCRELYVQDCYAGHSERHRINLRVVTEHAWHSIFARNMFVQIDEPEELATHVPEFTIIHAPNFHALPELDATNSEAFVIIHFERKEVIIGGTSYAGEIKKSIFSVLNFLLPQDDVLSMHCSANVGIDDDDDVALFFGLSGTGKTTLSSDPLRRLIGDDEHGWSGDGVFNFEGGCYAKVIRLSPEAEPQIYATTRKFGTVLENVVFDPRSRRIDLDDGALTENTRAAYPLSHIDNSVREGTGGHPRNVVMLTADAFGVLPPIARMNLDQAMYHFLSGYTAKVAGTERGVTEPFATFSACFGAPFLTLPPAIYAGLLREKVEKRGVDCWLVNTGWTGGPFGEGRRMAIAHTRAMLNAALGGKLDGVEMRPDPVFGLDVPASCEGVPPGVLDPRSTWRDTAAYDKKAGELAARFAENFEQYRGEVSAEVIAAGPRIA